MTELPAGWPWKGRVDEADGDKALRWHQLVRPRGSPPAPVALLGFACDAGVARNGGRTGAAEGPAAIRRALGNFAAHDVVAADDLGDVRCEGDALEAAQEAYAAAAAAALQSGSLVVGLGGGHEIAFASYLALSHLLEYSGSRDPVGVINFDAHFDLRADARANSGTPFRQILEHGRARGREMSYFCLGISRHSNTAALFERARSLGVQWVEDLDLRAERFAALERELREFVARHPRIYLTVCLDVLPGAAAPGVSAPAALGVDPALVDRLVEAVIGTGQVAIADVAEMNPRFDQDDRTARLAARFVAHLAAAVRR
ncbi:MAG: formimidoylglutamase [Gammaproteobacteria bacterium]